MQTRVCISIDTEFSIAGAFQNPQLKPVAEQRVWCDVNGQSQGLGFMLECFSRFDVTATFFVEALHRQYFKHDPMRPIVNQLRQAGHDIQLHAHPCWTIFQFDDWQSRARKTPRLDDFFRRDEDDSVRLINYGLEVFSDWGLPKPTVFRSGSLQHDDGLFRALAKTGIPYSSNIGLAIFDSGDDNYRLYSGRHVRHGVQECPVLTFSDWRVPGKQHLKSLTITGTSFTETRALLEQAHQEGIELVVILTHPFEYVQSRDFTLRQMRRHHVNQNRLTRLCAFLQGNRDRFITCGLGEAASVPLRPNSDQNKLLKGNPLHSISRMAEQFVYEKYGNWRLALS